MIIEHVVTNHRAAHICAEANLPQLTIILLRTRLWEPQRDVQRRFHHFHALNLLPGPDFEADRPPEPQSHQARQLICCYGNRAELFIFYICLSKMPWGTAECTCWAVFQRLSHQLRLAALSNRPRALGLLERPSGERGSETDSWTALKHGGLSFTHLCFKLAPRLDKCRAQRKASQ